MRNLIVQARDYAIALSRTRRGRAKFAAVLAMAFTLRLAHGNVAPYEWTPGSVFREHTFNGSAIDDGTKPRAHFSEVDPGSKREKAVAMLPNVRAPRPLTFSIRGVTRAELLPEYWGGHIGSTAWLQVNRAPWRPLIRPAGTSQPAEHYYHTLLGNRAMPVPVAALIEGDNTFRFTAGPQIFGNFDYGFFWVYAFTVRLYHERSAEHPSVVIANVRDSGVLPEHPLIALEPRAGGAPIRRVDVFAWYEDFNYSGSGFHREWHAQTIFGRPHRHVGSATAAPWIVRWNTEWMPDQSEPMRLVARVVDEAGWHSVSPVVDNLRFARRERRVLLVKAAEVPEKFMVRNTEMGCAFHVSSMSKPPSRARIFLSTWSADHVSRIRLNDTAMPPPAGFGRHHDFALDVLDVPPRAVREGRNEFALASARVQGHAAEVNWPGPVLLLEFRND